MSLLKDNKETLGSLVEDESGVLVMNVERSILRSSEVPYASEIRIISPSSMHSTSWL